MAGAQFVPVLHFLCEGTPNTPHKKIVFNQSKFSQNPKIPKFWKWTSFFFGEDSHRFEWGILFFWTVPFERMFAKNLVHHWVTQKTPKIKQYRFGQT